MESTAATACLMAEKGRRVSTRGWDDDSMSQRQRNGDGVYCRFKEDEVIHDAIIRTNFSVLYIYNLSKKGESKIVMN